jgi:hypothetical protein
MVLITPTAHSRVDRGGVISITMMVDFKSIEKLERAQFDGIAAKLREW